MGWCVAEERHGAAGHHIEESARAGSHRMVSWQPVAETELEPSNHAVTPTTAYRPYRGSTCPQYASAADPIFILLKRNHQEQWTTYRYLVLNMSSLQCKDPSRCNDVITVGVQSLRNGAVLDYGPQLRCVPCRSAEDQPQSQSCIGSLPPAC